MAISRFNEIERELYFMVRKECIDFLPKDWIDLDMKATNKNGEASNVFLGSLYYNSDYGKLMFHMYDQTGRLIVPNDGATYRSLDILPEKSLEKLRDVVTEYFNLATCRARNIRDIVTILDEEPSKGVYFDAVLMPNVSVDLNRDGNYDEGLCGYVYQDEKDSKYYAVAGTGTDVIRYPLLDLSDNSINAICTRLKLKKQLSLSDSLMNSEGVVDVEKRDAQRMKKAGLKIQ